MADRWINVKDIEETDDAGIKAAFDKFRTTEMGFDTFRGLEILSERVEDHCEAGEIISSRTTTYGNALAIRTRCDGEDVVIIGGWCPYPRY